MAAFYADENFPLPVVDALRRLGHDVLTAFEAGQANQRIPDDAVLGFASRAGRALLTLDRWDFVSVHSRIPGHAGSSSAHKIPTSIGRRLRSTQPSEAARPCPAP